MTRTALLIRCEGEEAERIRVEAQKKHQTISSYVLYIALQAIANSQFAEFNQYRRSLSAGSRTAVLVRCTVSEAEQIRESARRCAMPINAFILGALKSAWTRPTLQVSRIEAPRNLNRDQPSRTN